MWAEQRTFMKARYCGWPLSCTGKGRFSPPLVVPSILRRARLVALPLRWWHGQRRDKTKKMATLVKSPNGERQSLENAKVKVKKGLSGARQTPGLVTMMT